MSVRQSTNNDEEDYYENLDTVVLGGATQREVESGPGNSEDIGW